MPIPRVAVSSEPSGRNYISRGRGQLEKSVHQFTRDDINLMDRLNTNLKRTTS